jgi:hypothetical protein
LILQGKISYQEDPYEKLKKETSIKKYKLQYRNTKSITKEENVTTTKFYNTSITESKTIEKVEMIDKNSSLLLKMIKNIKKLQISKRIKY